MAWRPSPPRARRRSRLLALPVALRVALLAVPGLGLLAAGCPAPAPPTDHGPIAPDIAAAMGEVVPSATDEERATFERGRQVALRRFGRGDGLGPAFNVTFCGSCHERPTLGGSAGLYRSFSLGGVLLSDGSFLPAASAGAAGGVLRIYSYDGEIGPRPALDPELDVVAKRNPIPFFGVGLLAELPDDAILEYADPDDADGDGISGRPNYDRGFVGRFGRKSQTVSIEGFIRGPLFNHLGITTVPLSEEEKARLPVDSSSLGGRGGRASLWLGAQLGRLAQASAPDEPTVDDDGVPDPELSSADLFDVIAFSMLLAAPVFDEPTPETRRGMAHFDRVGCPRCHRPRIEGPRGPLPVYSDLLLHDLGPALADGIRMKEASGAEFRTQPLWGVGAVGPYLHDGRASTLEEAILLHGGEAQRARDGYDDLGREEKDELLAFLRSLGGSAQRSTGLLPPGTPVPGVGEWGGPARALDAEGLALFERGREVFDREHGFEGGLGSPRLNGDSCRACHFDPVLGGSGPRDVNVMRHGILNGAGEFVPPTIGTILHRTTRQLDSPLHPQSGVNVYEHRQTPHVFGLGLIESVPQAVILALADPDDRLTPDGITGRVSVTDGGRPGRFGWKAQVPTIAEFVRDALTAELGLTLPYQEGLTFGRLHDTDDVPDPEFTLEDAELLARFLAALGPPPRTMAGDPALVARGEALFESTGCASCHVPALPGAEGPVPLYSDLLLHEILPPGASGVEDASAGVREFRTAPLWGLARTAPYFHTGEAETIEDAVGLHDGEAAAIRDAFGALAEADRAALLAFLGTL